MLHDIFNVSFFLTLLKVFPMAFIRYQPLKVQSFWTVWRNLFLPFSSFWGRFLLKAKLRGLPEGAWGSYFHSCRIISWYAKLKCLKGQNQKESQRMTSLDKPHRKTAAFIPVNATQERTSHWIYSMSFNCFSPKNVFIHWTNKFNL